jgi:hypothetical protein
MEMREDMSVGLHVWGSSSVSGADAPWGVLQPPCAPNLA